VNETMRTISWTKQPLIILFAAAIAAGCGSDSTPGKPAAEGGLCSNDKKDPGEMCDGKDLDKKTCQTAGMGTFTGGTLKCATTCKAFDVTGCTKAGTGGGGGMVGSGGAPIGNGGAPSSGGKKGLDGGADSGSGGSGGTANRDSGTKPVVDSGKD
jgi:hypothetical protein